MSTLDEIMNAERANFKRRLDMLVELLEDPKLQKPGKFHLGGWHCSYRQMIEQFASYDDPADKPMRELAQKGDGGHNFKAIGRVNEKSDYMLVEPLDCKTAGCAIGWAASHPPFNEEGFRLVVEHYLDQEDQEDCLSSKYSFPIYLNSTKVTPSTGIPAVEEFFGVKGSDFHWLFDQTAYGTVEDRSNPLAVAKRVRQYIAYRYSENQ